MLTTTPYAIRLYPDQISDLQRKRVTHGVPVSEQIRRALDFYLDQYEPVGPESQALSRREMRERAMSAEA